LRFAACALRLYALRPLRLIDRGPADANEKTRGEFPRPGLVSFGNLDRLDLEIVWAIENNPFRLPDVFDGIVFAFRIDECLDGVHFRRDYAICFFSLHNA